MALFDWLLPPAQGQPGYQPHQPQAPQRAASLDDLVDRPGQRPPPGTNDLVDRPDQTAGMYRQIPAAAEEGPVSSEPYIPSRNDRPPSQWGTDDFALAGARNYPGMAPGPYMPQARDLAPLLHGIVMGMGRYGSHYSGMPAIAMGTYASAYWAAYQKGMHERAGTAWQQYQQAHQMFIDRQKEEFQAESEAYALYQDDPEKLHNALMQLAGQYSDTHLRNALESGNPAAVERLLGQRDMHLQDAAKIKAQQDRQKLLDEHTRLENDRIKKQMDAEEARKKALEKERQRYDPSATGPGPGYVPNYGQPATPEPAPDADTESTPDADSSSAQPSSTATADAEPAPDTPDTLDDTAASQRPIRTADASGTVPIGRGASVPPPPDQSAGKPESPEIERAAKNYVFNGGKLPPGLDKKNLPDIAGRIEGRAGQLKDWLDNLESDPKVNPKTISSAVRSVFPTLADKIDGYLAGKLTPSTRANDEEWRRAIALGYRINPEFSQGTFQSRQQGLAAWTRGDRGNNLSSIGIAMDHAQTLLEHLSKKPWPYTAEIARRIGGKDTALLDSDIETFSEEYVRAMSGKGPTIPELNAEKEKLNLNYPESYLRSLVEERIHLLQTKLREKQAQFESETGFPAQDIMRRFKNFTETDPLATNRDRQGAGGLERLDKWKPGGGSQTNGKVPTVPPGSPSGSTIMLDPKTKKHWLVYPDKSVHELPQ